MKRILLDTHALLWFIEGDKQLSKTARINIEDPKNEVYVSITSFFEITNSERNENCFVQNEIFIFMI